MPRTRQTEERASLGQLRTSNARRRARRHHRAGDLEASELIYRLHLEIDDDEHMPPEDKPQPTEDQEKF